MGSYPELEVLWVQWECCDSTAELNTLMDASLWREGPKLHMNFRCWRDCRCLVNTGIIMTI